jgi:hypothetical protein
MSRILRRPMFRGGRVDSYGTGIASGLGYKKGGVIDGHKISSDGRVNFNIAGLVSPEMASEMANIKTGGERTGASFLKRAVNKLKGIPYAGRLIPKFSTMAAAGTASVPYLAAAAPVAAVGGLAYMNRPKTVEALQYMKEMNESGVFDETAGDDYTQYAETFKMLNETGTPLNESEVGLTSSKEDISSDIMDRDMAGFEEVTTEPGADRRPGESSLDALLRQGLERSKQRDLLENPPSQEEEEQTIKSQLEKDKELFKELLGADKARGKDIGDMLASASASFLGTGDVREGFAEFMADQAKSGPSRTEKINQTAAGLAINDYIAGRRSKESLDQVLAKTKFGIDYASQMQQEVGSPKGKTWINALRIVGSSLKESTFSNKTIKDTLFQIFEKPTHIINDFQSKEYDDIDTEDLRVGFNIVPYKRGKIIIEKSSDGSVKPRTDLPIS